jgi:hypothetical protein
MLHIALHLVLPPLVALLAYRSRWGRATLLMLATMLVDVDHLLADPVYDPERCSIGFHPLHSVPAIVLWALLFAVPLALARRRSEPLGPRVWTVHVIGAGLLLHMGLDGLDCMRQAAGSG